MRNNFTLKWSKPKNADEHCNRTVTLDGNWKIARSKCYYDQMTIELRNSSPYNLAVPKNFKVGDNAFLFGKKIYYWNNVKKIKTS